MRRKKIIKIKKDGIEVIDRIMVPEVTKTNIPFTVSLFCIWNVGNSEINHEIPLIKFGAGDLEDT